MGSCKSISLILSPYPPQQSSAIIHITGQPLLVAVFPRSSYPIARYVSKLSIQDRRYPGRAATYRCASMETTFPLHLKKLSFLKELEFNFFPSILRFTWPVSARKEIKGAFYSVPLESLAFHLTALLTSSKSCLPAKL